MSDEIYKLYAHSPPHLFRPGAAYMITAGTYQKLPHIQGEARKRLWFESLLFVIGKEQWAKNLRSPGKTNPNTVVAPIDCARCAFRSSVRPVYWSYYSVGVRFSRTP